MNRISPWSLLMCALLSSLAADAFPASSDPLDEAKAAALLKGRLAITRNYLWRVDEATFSKDQFDTYQMAFTGPLVFTVETRKIASDNPSLRNVQFADVVNYDLCNVYPPQKVELDEVMVWRDDGFYYWEDVVRPRFDSSGVEGFRRRPIRMDPADVAKARSCLKGPASGYRALPMSEIEIQVGDKAPLRPAFVRRGDRSRNGLDSCDVPVPLTRVLFAPAKDASGKFGVEARALSTLRCTSRDGLSQRMQGNIRFGVSAPVAMRLKDKVEDGRLEFVMDDSTALGKTPELPRYSAADLEAAFGSRLDAESCAADFAGLRLTFLYEGKVMNEQELWLGEKCPLAK